MLKSFKPYIIYLILSIMIIIFGHYAHQLILYLIMAYAYLNIYLAPLFGKSMFWTMFREILCLVLLPLIIAGIPALIYRAIKGRHMPYFLEIVWVLWLLIVLNKVLVY